MITKITKIDAEKVREFAKKNSITLKDMSYAIGRSESYLSYAMSSGNGIPTTTFELLCRVYDVPAQTFLPDQTQKGYTAELSITGNKALFVVKNDGEKVVSATSWVKGETELDIMQAISYAAHMCYKFAQQKTWK